MQIDIKESPLFWPVKRRGTKFLVLDETLIPQKLRYIPVTNTREAVQVIRTMKTRAFGQFLVVLNTFLMEINNAGKGLPVQERLEDGPGKPFPAEMLFNKIKTIADAFNKSRPTFPFAEVTGMVVHWAQKALEEKTDIRRSVSGNIQGYLEGIRGRRLERVRRIAELIQDGDSILTHCNVSGELAMAAAICRRQNKDIRFFAAETRPYLQGTKLTAWELKRIGAKVTLVADNAVGSLMADGLVNKVIVGSDRSCANGDFANKIGTYQIAVLAREFEIPFYVLTQPSDKIKRGEDIPIEIRDSDELLSFAGKRWAPEKVNGFYPGFDVVPHELITEAIAINVR